MEVFRKAAGTNEQTLEAPRIFFPLWWGREKIKIHIFYFIMNRTLENWLFFFFFFLASSVNVVLLFLLLHFSYLIFPIFFAAWSQGITGIFFFSGKCSVFWFFSVLAHFNVGDISYRNFFFNLFVPRPTEHVLVSMREHFIQLRYNFSSKWYLSFSIFYFYFDTISMHIFERKRNVNWWTEYKFNSILVFFFSAIIYFYESLQIRHSFCWFNFF